jgi:transposase
VGKSRTIGVDLAKSVFEVAISREPGRVSQRRRVSRSQMARLLADEPSSTVLMEACGSAHYWGRVFEGQGHEVRLLPAHHVSRYRLGNKTDRADVDALLEAGRNERIFPVPVKSVAQQTLTALHRLRCEWVATRTARLNGLRGLLREIGIVIPRGARRVLPAVGDALGRGQVPQELHIPMMACCEEIRGLEEKIRQVEEQLAAIAKESGAVKSLLSVPGIGLLTATAMIGLVGSAGRFRSGRRYASFLGLVPREFSSGNTRRLGGISKRGDGYLRTLLIHGARAVLIAAKRAKNPDRLRLWALQLEKRRGHNRAATALANKLARIAWAVWSKATLYQPARLAPCS